MSHPPPYNPNFAQPPPPPPQAGWSVPSSGPGYPPQQGYPQDQGYPQQPGYPPNTQQNSYGGGANFGPPPPPPPPAHGYAGGVYGTAGSDPEWGGAPKDNGIGFSNRSIRQGFIRKVFMILTCQLTFVTALVAFFVFYEKAGLFVRQNLWLMHISYVAFLITYIVIVCCEGVRRRFPGNFICLFVLTASLGFMTAMISSFYEKQVVIIALAVTVVTCGSIILFAMQTKYDFTGCIGVMFVVSIVLFLFGIILIIFGTAFRDSKAFPIAWIVYCGLATLVFMVYLAIDVQLVIGGKRFELSPEDYILAATQLFIDIVYIFLYLLQIVGLSSK